MANCVRSMRRARSPAERLKRQPQDAAQVEELVGAAGRHRIDPHLPMRPDAGLWLHERQDIGRFVIGAGKGRAHGKATAAGHACHFAIGGAAQAAARGQ